MGAREVLSAIIDWAVAALHENPLLVAPTLVIALGVVGLAVIEAVTLTVQVATAMIRHYRHRFAELAEAFADLWLEIVSKRKPRGISYEVTHPRNIQRERLSQQRLFDRNGDAKSTEIKSA
jgi:hypothetical protein